MQSSKNPQKLILPELAVIKAFFESYLTIRQKTWKIKLDQPVIIIKDPDVAAKIQSCRELLNQLCAATTFDDWINLIYTYADKAHQEELEKNKKRLVNLYGLFDLGKMFRHEYILKPTIDAALSYLCSELDKNEQFKQLISTLGAEKIALTKLISEWTDNKVQDTLIAVEKEKLNVVNDKLFALTNFRNYHLAFFLQIIEQSELKETKFEEKSFEDYKKHVLSGERKQIICDNLLTSAKLESTEPTQTQTVESEKKSKEANHTPSDSKIANEEKNKKASALAANSIVAKSKKGEKDETYVVHNYRLRR